MKILVIAGSPRKNSYSRILAEVAYKYTKEKKVDVDFLDLAKTDVDAFKGYGEKYSKKTKETIESLKKYDLFLITAPVYDGGFSSALKNIFEHSNPKDLRGKVTSFIIMSGGMKSHLLVHGQLIAMMNYFSIFSNPKAVYVSDTDFKEKALSNENIKERIKDLVDSSIKITEKLVK